VKCAALASAFIVISGWIACTPPPPSNVPQPVKKPSRVSLWPEADRLFHQDPKWLGGDSAYSVDLGDSRSLWLFGDSFIATSDAHVRKEAVMVHNAAAIQEGSDPSSARMTFGWGGDYSPTSLVPDTRDHWYWPGHGVKVHGRVLLFYWYVRRAEGGLGFSIEGWSALRMHVPDSIAQGWEVDTVRIPKQTIGGVLLGSSVILRGGYIEAYGFTEPNHNVYVARWPESAVDTADLSTPEWWTTSGWMKTAEPDLTPVMAGAETELSITPWRQRPGFLELQTYGFGAATIGIRFADNPLGPWSAATQIFRPPESGLPHTLVYSAKAHPELTGADLVLTYNTNSTDLGSLVADPSIYYPRFVRVTF
jgi:hypothetical protein